MPVFSYVRAMYDLSKGHEDEFTDLELKVMRDHCELGMAKKQLIIKYKEECDNIPAVLSKIEWKLHRLRHKETRRKILSQR